MAISPSAGANVNPEEQKANLKIFEEIIKHITSEILKMENSFEEVVTMGLNGSSVAALAKNYERNRQVISDDIRNLSIVYHNIADNLNANIVLDESRSK